MFTLILKSSKVLGLLGGHMHEMLLLSFTNSLCIGHLTVCSSVSELSNVLGFLCGSCRNCCCSRRRGWRLGPRRSTSRRTRTSMITPPAGNLRMTRAAMRTWTTSTSTSSYPATQSFTPRPFCWGEATGLHHQGDGVDMKNISIDEHLPCAAAADARPPPLSRFSGIPPTGTHARGRSYS